MIATEPKLKTLVTITSGEHKGKQGYISYIETEKAHKKHQGLTPVLIGCQNECYWLSPKEFIYGEPKPKKHQFGEGQRVSRTREKTAACVEARHTEPSQWWEFPLPQKFDTILDFHQWEGGLIQAWVIWDDAKETPVLEDLDTLEEL